MVINDKLHTLSFYQHTYYDASKQQYVMLERFTDKLHHIVHVPHLNKVIGVGQKACYEFDANFNLSSKNANFVKSTIKPLPELSDWSCQI